MTTHWPEFMQRKNPLIKEQYRLAINFFKTVGVPFGKQPGESWTDYVARVTKPAEYVPTEPAPIVPTEPIPQETI